MTAPRTVRELLNRQATQDLDDERVRQRVRILDRLDELRAAQVREYIFRAQELTEAFYNLIGADALRARLTKSSGDINPGAFNMKFAIPAPPPALRPQGWSPHSALHGDWVAGAVPHVDAQRASRDAAMFKLEETLRAEFGSWPFKE